MAKVLPAIVAVADAVARPAIAKDALHVVPGHDLAVHLGHKVLGVGAERAGDPMIRRGPVPARMAKDIDGHPLGMRGSGVIMDGVRIRARQYDHV